MIEETNSTNGGITAVFTLTETSRFNPMTDMFQRWADMLIGLKRRKELYKLWDSYALGDVKSQIHNIKTRVNRRVPKKSKYIRIV